LTLVRTLVSNVNAGANPKIAAATPGLAPAKPPVVEPVAPAPKVAAAKPPAPATPVAPAPAASARVAPTPSAQVAAAKPEPVKPEPKPAPNNNGEQDEVLNAVNGWARAWSSQDVKSYLNFYGGDFQTPNGQARNAWEDERRSRIAGKGRIHVKIEAPQVTINGSTATVKFRQIYVSDRLTANSRKTLVLTKRSGKWQIKQEKTGG
jgi:hypothetical protein